MNLYRHILITLDLSQLDETLLSYSHFLSNIVETETLTGAHIIPVYLIGGMVKLDPQQNFMPVAPAVELIREQVYKEMVCQFEGTNISLRVNIEEGRPFNKLMKIIDKTLPDLLVFGKKKNSTGSGIIGRRIAHRVKSDILFVPENAKPQIENILVPIDMSENSWRVLYSALQLKKMLGIEAALECVHVVNVLPKDRYQAIDVYSHLPIYLPEKAREQYRNFLRHYRIDEKDLHITFLDNSEENISKVIYNYAKLNNHDFIMMGAVGHSPVNNFLFGSVAEGLLSVCDEIPILVIR